MGKIIKTLFAFVFAVSVLLVVFIIYLVKFSDASFLGKIVKENIIRNLQLVRLFNLQKPGDGRFEYLSDASQALNVDVYLLENIVADNDLEEWIDGMVLETVGRGINFSAHTLSRIEQKDEYADNDLDQIIKLTSENEAPTGSRPGHLLPSLRREQNPSEAETSSHSSSDLRQRFSAKGDKKDNFLNIIYLTHYKPDPRYLGITINKDTIFIFKGGFEGIGENEKVLRRIEQSTIMHEWGHLLGLGHVESEDCIMSEMVHFYSDRELWTGEVPTQYCAETLYEIKKMKN